MDWIWKKVFQMQPKIYDECQGGQPRIVSKKLNFDSEDLKEKVNQEYPQLDDQQKIVYDDVLESAIQNYGQIFALGTSGRTGKPHTTSCPIL